MGRYPVLAFSSILNSTVFFNIVFPSTTLIPASGRKQRPHDAAKIEYLDGINEP
jgi:hypothetical protein